MAQYAGNDVYLSINGTDVSAYFTETVELEQTADVKEAPYGAGLDYQMRVGGLIDTPFSFTLIYDVETANKADSFDLLRANDEITLIYGPEGSASGKPKHEGKFLIENLSGPSVSINKEPVMVEISVVQSAAPTTDMYNGGTFA